MLEAVLVVSIMVSAAAFVVTFDTPGVGAGAAREGLELQAEDALAILHDTPIDSNFGDDELSAFIAECLNTSCDNLTARLRALVPPGASYALYISNGVETYPVLIQGEPAGEAVTAVQPFEPRWSSTFLATATESVAPDDALLVYALPIFHSNPITPGGSQLFVKVMGTRTDGSDYVLIGSFATLAYDNDDPEAIAASLFFADADGEPLAVHDLGDALDETRRMTVRLEESQGAPIPAGAEVAVHIPRGFTAIAPQEENAGWRILANATDANGAATGSTLRANLTDAVVSDVVDLVFDLTYHGDVLEYYPFVATLSRGATATASVLVRAEDHATDPALATPSLLMSVPSPMGKSAWTTWTLSAYVPVSSAIVGSLLPETVDVHTIEISEKEGYDIFDCAASPPIVELGAGDGDWTCAADRLVWSGSAGLDYESVLNLSFQVKASGTGGPNDARSQFIPPVEFDDWTGRLVERTGWGFYKGAVLPSDGTYEGFESAVGADKLLRSDGPYRSTPLPGSMRYNVSTLAAVQDALYGSYVTTNNRNVPVGGEVVIDANVQSVLFTLADVGQRAGVTLRFYPPWSGDERIPIYEQENLDQGLLNGEVTQMVVLDVNDDGVPDPIVGTSNGRVLAYHGLTGQRLQGNSFTAPLLPEVSETSGTTSVTAMDVYRYDGEDFIVVGFDSSAAYNLYVLDEDLATRWVATTQGGVAAIDASADIDRDGEDDVVVIQSYRDTTTDRAVVYALRPTEGTSRLEPIDTPLDGDALADVLGTPTTVAALASAGPRGETAGILVPIQTLYETGVEIDTSVFPASVTQGSSSTPRAGVTAVDRWAEETSTLFGTPASVIRAHDHGGDAVDDAVFGGSSGYVVMANGTVLTQPIYSYIVVNTAFVDGDARSSAETYTLTLDGTVLMTDDAWVSTYASTSQFPGAKAVSSNSTGHYWVAGPLNGLWHTVDAAATAPDPTHERHPAARDFIPLPLTTTTRAGVPYDITLRLHELRDVHARGATIHVVGTRCAIFVDCTEPIVLRSTDSGGNWSTLSVLDATLRSSTGGLVDDDLNRIEFVSDGTGWIVGDSGTLLRSDDDGASWTGIATGTTYHLRDIDCKPSDPTTCLVVGDAGATFLVTGATTSPSFANLTGERGLPSDRTFYTVGYVEDERVYIGAPNMMLASFTGSNFTTLPMNYLENTPYAISTTGDGTGFAYGGGANPRMWLLHDYHTQSRAVTTSYASLFPADARIYSVSLVDSNVTVAQQEIEVNVTRGGEWKTLGRLVEGGEGEDPRNAYATSFATFDPATGGRDLRFNVTMNTSGDKTILSPHARWLTFEVAYETGPVATPTSHELEVTLDFSNAASRDATLTTADWNTSIGALRQPLVREYWTRNVSGQVYDIRSGFDIDGDGRDEVWVSTGDIFAENSPDHVIYAGSNHETRIGGDHRVYLLNGTNGNTTRISAHLSGEVRQIRLSDKDGNGWPETVFAVAWDSAGGDGGLGTLYALNATTLDVLWSVELGAETVNDMEVGRASAEHAAVFVGTQRAVGANDAMGHLWALNGTDHSLSWRIIADEMGRYVVRAPVPANWLFGPYVVEIEVEWEETVTAEGGLAQNVLRSARFYDHFMATPPDALSPPTPVYSAKLLVWMREWS